MNNKRNDKKMARKKTGFNKSEYDKVYIRENIDRIPFNSPKKERMRELIKLAASYKNISSNAYITMAVKYQLNIDGISIDLLDNNINDNIEE